MKSLFKVTLLATTMAFALNATRSWQPMPPNRQKPLNQRTRQQHRAPASSKTTTSKRLTHWAPLGRYMDNSLKEQEKLGIKLDKDQLIAGVQDAFANKSKLNDADIEKTLQGFEARVKASAQAKMEQDAKDNETKGAKYRDSFAKEKGVKKTESGLLYR